MAEACNIKLGTHVGSAKGHDKITLMEKMGMAVRLGSSQNYWVPFIISEMAVISDIEVNVQLCEVLQ